MLKLSWLTTFFAILASCSCSVLNPNSSCKDSEECPEGYFCHPTELICFKDSASDSGSDVASWDVSFQDLERDDAGRQDAESPDSNGLDNIRQDVFRPDVTPSDHQDDASVPDSGTADSGLPDSGLSDSGGLCTSDTCNGHGVCDDSSGAALCSCNGSWDPDTDCAICLVGFGGTDCSSIATLAVTKNPGAETTMNNGLDLMVLKWRESASGGTAYVVKRTFSAVFSGPGSVTSKTLYRSGVVRPAAFYLSAGRIATVNATEDQVVQGSPIDYLLYLRVIGVSLGTGETLTVCLLGDSSATPTMAGSTGFLYSASGSTLYTSANSLCSADPPYFVYAGVPHTPPPLACPVVAGSGSPGYSTGFEAGTWTVCNTLTAP